MVSYCAISGCINKGRAGEGGGGEKRGKEREGERGSRRGEREAERVIKRPISSSICHLQGVALVLNETGVLPFFSP